jgi:hypothetical protein
VAQEIQIDAVHVVIDQDLCNGPDHQITDVFLCVIGQSPDVARVPHAVFRGFLGSPHNKLGTVVLPLSPKLLEPIVVDVVHSKRPEDFRVVLPAPLDGQPERVRSHLQKTRHSVVLFGAEVRSEHFKHFTLVSEHADHRSAIEDRIHPAIREVVESNRLETLPGGWSVRDKRIVRHCSTPHVVLAWLPSCASHRPELTAQRLCYPPAPPLQS